MPRFKSIIFYQNSPKIKIFLQKSAKLLSAGNSASRPPSLRRLWLQTPTRRRLGAPPPDLQNSPHPLRISGYATEFSRYDIRASKRIFFRGTKIDTGTPKLGEEHKKRSSLKFGPIFCPKLGEEQKRSSLKFGPISCSKLGEEQK